MSAGTVGRDKEGGEEVEGRWEECGRRDSWVEKYPELEQRADLLQGMGVPLAVTSMSSESGDEREVNVDQGNPEGVGSIFDSASGLI